MTFSYKALAYAFIAFILLGWYVYRTYGTTATPSYSVISRTKSVEVRAYPELIFAETIVSGELRTALNTGFRRLASYIFAKQRDTEKIEMTAPVLFQPVERKNQWRMRFILPERFVQATPPTPVSDDVCIVREKACHVATLPVPGAPDYKTWQKYEKALRADLTNDYSPCETAWFARYDAPWIPPFLRRNEILIKKG
jgi:hypothetical protein